MSDTKPRKTDVQKLQRAIVDGLEDVKGQDIVVFNTEHLSPLFERVIIASGTSNRQTKALASSISDAVREAGFPKPRVEGEENGEWIIVDCGAAVAHVMQPSIRQYYHLEEIWGGKTVNLKQAAPAKAAAASEPAAKVGKGSKAAKADKLVADTPAKAKKASKAAEVDAEATAKPKAKAKSAAKAAEAPVAKPAAKSAGKPAAKLASKTVGKAASAKAAPAKTAARKTTTDTKAAPAAKVKTLVVGKPSAKKVAAKSPARKVVARKKAS